jgi:hypothetical protein
MCSILVLFLFVICLRVQADILQKGAEDKKFLQAANRIVMPLLELFTTSKERIILAALKLINIVVRVSPVLRDSVCLLGKYLL